MRSGDEILEKRLGLDPWSFGSFAFPMICTCALVVIVASGNGRTGLTLMAIRSWAATGCGALVGGDGRFGGLNDLVSISPSGPSVGSASAPRPVRAPRPARCVARDDADRWRMRSSRKAISEQ